MSLRLAECCELLKPGDDMGYWSIAEDCHTLSERRSCSCMISNGSAKLFR